MSITEQIIKVTIEKGSPTLTEVLEQCTSVDATGKKIIHVEDIAAYFGVDANELMGEVRNQKPVLEVVS